MKTKSRSKKQSRQWLRASLLGRCVMGAVLATGAGVVRGADDQPKAPSPEEMFEGGSEPYNNWVEVSAGGLFTSGSKAKAQELQHMTEGAFGGISDLHYGANLDKTTTLSLDGRALFDQHDYKLALELRREKLGYVKFGYKQFRTWYDGDGGFYRAGDIWYPAPDNTLALDRGELTFEAGLRLEKAPQVTFKYTHRFRDGDKSSTSWGQSHANFASPIGLGLNPSFYDIDETADIFELDVTHQIKKTALGVGVRYETGKINDARYLTQFPGEGTQRSVTDREGTSYDMFSAHAFSETWFKPTLMLSSGFLYANLDTDTSGSRIYGNDYNVSYSPDVLNGLGYDGLVGGSQMREYVMNLNLLVMPRKDLTIVPSIKVRKEDWNSDSAGDGTTGTAAPLFSASNSDGDLLDVTERLDVNYTGFTNWVVYARGEWTQGSGNLQENGGIEQIAPITRVSEDTRNFQKYSVGTRWYPARRLSLDAGAYYKINSYDYDHAPFPVDSTVNSSGNRYPAYLVMQDFETYDGNLRLTWRPVTKLSLVTRYEYQYSTIHTTPDPASGLSEAEASTMTSHIIGQNVSWTPWSRLYLQAGINYVFSETKTPVSDYTQAILNAQNNYWTVNLNSGFVVDDKTDLTLGYFYYRADDYTDNSTAATPGVPFGAGSEEHGATALLTRRLTDRLRVSLKYSYLRYTDQLSGGHTDTEAHLLYSSLQYRF